MYSYWGSHPGWDKSHYYDVSDKMCAPAGMIKTLCQRFHVDAPGDRILAVAIPAGGKCGQCLRRKEKRERAKRDG